MSKRTLRLFGLLALLVLGAPARLPAQWSTPYDPDFASEKKEEQKTAATTGEAEQAEAPLIMPEGSGPFLLLDREDPSHIFEVSAATEAAPSKEFFQFESELKPFQYSQAKYNKARLHREQGIVIEENPTLPGGEYNGPRISTSAPKPPPPEIEMPAYGTSLSVTGRKVISMSFSEKRFLKDQSVSGRPQTTNIFDIQQQLQLRMQGKVGPKITVNVDYDDTKANHQDISVVYSGDPGEVVQNVSFGDIDLSLPATEFVSYNKQLFGIRADVKYKGIKASVVGSRTKGTTKSKQFFGNTQFVSEDVPDTAYLRRQYYDLTFGNPQRLPLRPGSEQIFLATQQAGNSNTNTQFLTADDLVLRTSSFTGVFQRLSAGQDYTIDYIKGILTFRTPNQPNFVVGADYIDASGSHITAETSSTTLATGGTGLLKLLKTPGDAPIECSSCTADETGYNRELKTFYNLGQTQIVPDNGRGNFILKTFDLNRNDIGATLNPVQHYPETILVDFTNGLFQLQRPFAVPGDSSTADPNIYAPTPIQQHIFHAEFSFRFKTFVLEPNLVPQSEVVILDNQRLNRNVDYFIDYEAGFITFFNEDRIHTNSEIDISYEVSPFAGITNQSLLGTRVSYEINKHAAVGATLLYQAGTKAQTTPSITELGQSLLVFDTDTQLKDISLGKKLKLKTFSGEFAGSHQDLNLNSFAIVDNMEGIKQEDSASLFAASWQIASNPPAPGSGVPVDPTHFSLTNENIPVLTINPRAQATGNQTQAVLSYNYGPLAVGEEVSVVFPFSASGLDFSQRTLLETVVNGDNSGNQINFHLGMIAEDADQTGGIILHCASGQTISNAPKTEDTDCTGVLTAAKDVGWVYAPTTGPGAGKTLTVGARNGKLDTEDLNGNGRLDPQDFTGGDFGYLGGTVNGVNQACLPETGGNPCHTTIDFGGNINSWITLDMPLNISSATQVNWTNIHTLRITIKRAPGGLASGAINFARIAVVGNTWTPGRPTDPSGQTPPVKNETLVVTPVNNVDNPNYTPIYAAGGDAASVYTDLYGSVAQVQQQTNTTNVSEQALQMSFSNMTIVGGVPAVVTTKRVFTRPIDISQHRFFNFLVFGNADPAHVNTTDHNFFLRVGDDSNFFEVNFPINFTGWRKIRVYQQDSRGNSVADTWVASTPGTVVISSGVPNLSGVAEIVAGVRRIVGGPTPPGTATQGIVWLDEIHMAQPLARNGFAAKLQTDFEVPGWATFGYKYRSTDRNFQTPTSVVSNQDNRADSGYLNFSRLASFPMSFNLSRAIVVTPNTANVGNLSNITTLLQSGQITTWNGGASGSFNKGTLPRVGLSYARNRISYDLLNRLDDRNSYSSTLQYGVPSKLPVLPKTVDANYSYSLYKVNFNNLIIQEQPGNLNTLERTQSLGARLTFIPWTGSSFNPSYSNVKVREHRDDYASVPGVDVTSSYDKSLTQSVGFTSNYRVLSWLNPQVSYQVNTQESNILNVSTFIVSGSTYVFKPGDIKTVNRNANGSVNLPLAIGDIFHRSKLFHSLNIVSGYQLADGDVWNQVEDGLNTNGAMWIRTPLHPKGPASLLQSQTLRDTYNTTQRWSPLESYNIGGRLAPLKTISLSNNYVLSIQRQNVTGTRSKTTSTTFPDMIASVSRLEQLWHTEGWMSNTQLNFKLQEHKVLNVGLSENRDQTIGGDLRSQIFKRFDSLFAFNARQAISEDLVVSQNTQKTQHQDSTVQTTFDMRKFRFTPKVDYSHDLTQLGTGVQTQNVTVVTPSVLIRGDLSLPRGLMLPGTTRPILFSNRIIWTTTMSLAWRTSPVTQIDNFKLATFNTSADYEIAKNLRMTLNGAMSREWHKFLAQEDFVSYSFGSTLTFQF